MEKRIVRMYEHHKTRMDSLCKQKGAQQTENKNF